MRTFENIVRILIASVFGTLVTALEGNETSINAMDAPGKSDSDPYDTITTLTLTALAETYSNDTIDGKTLLNASETLLTSLQNTVEDEFDNIEIGKISAIDNEPAVSVNSSEDIVNHDPPGLAEDKKIIDSVLLGMRAMPDNATIWELFKAQVQADFAPLLIIIPRPIKRLIASNAVKIVRKIRIIVGGPMIPMFITAGRVLRVAGKSIVYIGEDVLRLSQFILTTWDGNICPEDTFSLQPDKTNDFDSTEREFQNSAVLVTEKDFDTRGVAGVSGHLTISNNQNSDDLIELDGTLFKEESIADSHLILETEDLYDNLELEIVPLSSDCMDIQQELQAQIVETVEDADYVEL